MLNFKPQPSNEKKKTDCSLKVMIPRAKYSHTALHHPMTLKKVDKAKRKSSTGNKSIRESPIEATVGALVSAGFEVSTIVNNQAITSTPETVPDHQNQIFITNFDTFLRSDEYVLVFYSFFMNYTQVFPSYFISF